MTFLRILRVTGVDFNLKPSCTMAYLEESVDQTDASDALEIALALASVENPYRGTVEALATPTWEYAAGPGGAGSYQGDDVALFQFKAGDASIFRYVVPCPDVSLFYPDEETIDPASASAAAIISWCLAYGASFTGSALAVYERGWRASIPSY